MTFRNQIPLGQISATASTSLARLNGIDGVSRSIMVGVLPLIALETFGDKETISSVYFFATLFTLFITINVATLEQILDRRRLVVLGGLFLIVSIWFFYLQNTWLFGIGIGLRAAGSSIFSVCMSLYVMDFIGKRDLTRNESKRMIYTGAAWLFGPSVGVWLYEYAPEPVLFIAAAGFSVFMIAYFLKLRYGDYKVIKAAQSQAKNPLKSVMRFVQQRRLRIAYIITLSRACFWAMLFVYGPIYVVEAGLPSWVGAILLSGTSGMLFLSPVIQRLADRYGTRQVLIACSLIIGFSTIALGLIGQARPIGIVFMVLGSLGAAGMDVLGNIPFMRTVRPRERTEMTMVFTTWREGSSLLTQGLIFLTLLVAPFWAFYFILAAMQFAAALGASYLPRRL